MTSFRQDARYALRMMRRSPGFTAVAVLSLALGIGANTAIFSLINTLMLRLLPVREPRQLVELLHRHPLEPDHRWFACSWQSYQYLRDQNHVFSDLIAMSPVSFNVRGEGLEPGRVDGAYVSGNFFSVLGVRAALGRLIGAEDDRMGAVTSAVAVVSWSYWQSRFGQAPAIVGRQILVDDVTVTIVGVLPREFFGMQVGSRQDVWIPVAMEAAIRHPSRLASGQDWLGLVGRLKPGVGIAQALADMTVLDRRIIEEENKGNPNAYLRGARLEMEPVGAGLSQLRDQFGTPLLVLMGLVGLLLLIACINVAGLLLARGAARQREMALRVALGAGRLRLLRQVLTESLLLSWAGGLLGILLAYPGTGALVRIITSGRARPFFQSDHIDLQVQPDVRVLLFTAGTALLTGVLFGLAPALGTLGSAPVSWLRAAGRSGETRFRRLFGKSLVVTQVALSVALVSTAGLFAAHLSDLRNLNLGFQREHVLLVNLDPARHGYSAGQLARGYRELLRRLEAIPGVRSATLSGASPISGAGASRYATVEGRENRPGEPRVSVNWVGPRYFETYGTPLLAGREFSFQDQGNSPAAIVNQAMARFYFGDSYAIGKHVTLELDKQPLEIVGVVGDAKYLDLREAPPRTIYLPAFQEARMYGHRFALRTNVDPAAVAGEVRRTVRAVLSGVAVERIFTLTDQMDASIVPERLIAVLSELFGALGSVLAAIGLYGLLAYTVARRINEIGIRMALGATRGKVIRMVVVDALGMVTAGLAAGVPMAFLGRRFAASLVTDLPVNGAGPVVFGAALTIAVGLLAAYAPARRASQVEPMDALRYE